MPDIPPYLSEQDYEIFRGVEWEATRISEDEANKQLEQMNRESEYWIRDREQRQMRGH